MSARRTPAAIRLSGLVALLAALAVSSASAAPAQITIVNADGANEGFNDPTAATPIGGNTGTTLGQQRLIAFQYAADIWGALLDSPVEIRVHATFDPLDCTATTAALGQARPGAIVSDSPTAPVPGAWYAVALASKFAGQDVGPGADDITAQFNSRLGETGCLDGFGWYYGLDDNHGELNDLVTVLLHELGHGLGFLTLVEESDGSEFLGQPDIFETFILDTTANKHWDEMTDSEREASAVNTGALVWDGGVADAAAPQFLGPLPVLKVNAPAAIAGDLTIGTAAFGPAVGSPPITGALVQAADAADTAGPATTDACGPLTNASAVAGKIALVDRGTCTFVEKAANVQAAGAIAMVVANNVAGGAIGMAGDAPAVTIPCVSVSQQDGATLAANLEAGVQVSLFENPRRLAGAGAGNRPLLYTPNPTEPGSSISHWDRSATPNLLMEPNLNSDLGHDVDLTLPLLRDIGWLSDAEVPTADRDAPAAAPNARETREVPRP